MEHNFLGDGLQAKVTVDVPDRLYLNLFATVFLAVTASALTTLLLRKIIIKK